MSAWLPADWPAPPGVRAGTTLRHGAGASSPPFDSFNLGNHRTSAGDDPAVVAGNRDALARLLALPSPPHWLRQVHGTTVLRFDAPAAGAAAIDAEPEADAAVTAVPGVVLAILTADCLPVVFAADDGGEIAAAHAGWRGLAAGVLEATVAAMRTSSSRLRVWLGPAAGPASYEIGAEVREAFTATDPGADAAFVATRADHWRVDLYALARRRLEAVGIRSDAIHGGDRDTIAESDAFFSHRRDGRSGRIATLAWMAHA
ncbi:peptidoglycan editing factor PgeF [Luteimonas sp. FCS-9]|uniref:peptidoglycan editing factor PgeF n=1 Tax=Luteimonas sp. FCS-9 TaxID=1547516 RepID=UPI00063ED36F|nr:peptidoglycan editing factor PgeF [Luteimonas sp. FCS-9]KLJ00123.1 laccase [Luteimonas sp. FCS-9]